MPPQLSYVDPDEPTRRCRPRRRSWPAVPWVPILGACVLGVASNVAVGVALAIAHPDRQGSVWGSAAAEESIADDVPSPPGAEPADTRSAPAATRPRVREPWTAASRTVDVPLVAVELLPAAPKRVPRPRPARRQMRTAAPALSRSTFEEALR